MKEILYKKIDESFLLTDKNKTYLKNKIFSISDEFKFKNLLNILESEKQFIINYLSGLIKENNNIDDLNKIIFGLKRTYLNKIKSEEEKEKILENNDILLNFF